MSTLYLVATPIGNLDDMSPRAVSVLQQVDMIGCEDTRKSGILLKRFNIQKPLFPFHQHNEHQKVSRITDLLDSGINLALISDAGTPGISDPGFLAVRAVHNSGHTVSIIPGPDAATSALVVSGLPSDRYQFEGFLPVKKGRQTRLKEISQSETTTIIYESPHRLNRLLKELEVFTGPKRLICIARELTKKFEEIQRGELGDLKQSWNERGTPKGEFVIILSGSGYSE